MSGSQSAIPQPATSASLEDGFEMPTPVLLTQVLWGWGPAIRVLTGLPDNSDAGYHLRIVALCPQWIPAPLKTLPLSSLRGECIPPSESRRAW